MANTYKNLYIGQPASSGTTLITVPSLKMQVIASIIAANSTGADATIAYYINGTTAAYMICPPTTVPAGGSFPYKIPLTLTAAETLYAVASSSTTITVCVSGCEIS